jgi:hypothetical protein
MTVQDNLRGVIDASMCIGCGACSLVDPSVNLLLVRE